MYSQTQLYCTHFDIRTQTTNDNSPITALGHGTHCGNNEISYPPPNTLKEHPHTSCIAALEVKSQPEDGQHIGPKHVVVHPLYL